MNAADIVEKLEEKASLLRDLNARVLFVLDGEAILLDATSNPVRVSQENGEADCTIRMSADNMAKMMDGKLNPMLAFTMGKLKVEGSKGVAMKLAGLFDE